MTKTDKGATLHTAFPKKIQKLVKGLVTYENYNEEYLLVSLLSAASSATGNAVQIRIKGQWITNPSLYVILVGHPGMGKSQPLDFAYKPIRAVDKVFRDEYVEKLTEYEQQTKRRNSPVMAARPTLRRTIISDFTPEALIMSHAVNPRGITIYVDELMGMFSAVNRYNNSPFVEQLLSAYSGKSLDVARVSMDLPLHIEHPCINVVGTSQTIRIEEMFRNGYQQNGLIDRFLFSYPLTNFIPLWDKTKAKQSTKVYFEEWEHILNKIISLPYDEEAGQWLEICFTTAARDHYYDWYNRIVEKLFANDVEDGQRERMMKTNLNVARIALIIQILRWACGEAQLTSVDLLSLKSAIQISEYFEDSYSRIGDFIGLLLLKPTVRMVFEGVGDTFSTSDALRAGASFGLSKRCVMYCLTDLLMSKKIKKIRRGKYKKVGKNTNI